MLFNITQKPTNPALKSGARISVNYTLNYKDVYSLYNIIITNFKYKYNWKQ